mmetsp:Transcript_28456/g.45851  ORF Transcript_28456/g.45851 Transcript_28456/m.45851 type:complete len:839 (+) Transcript_28456:242-2758(+)
MDNSNNDTNCVLLAIPIDGPCIDVDTHRDENELYFQTFNQALDCQIIGTQAHNVKNENCFMPMTKNGTHKADVVEMSSKGILVAGLDNCSLVACETQNGAKYGECFGQPWERYDTKLSLPYRTEQLCCSADSSILVACFGKFSEDVSVAAAVVAIFKARRFGNEEEGEWQLQLSVLRHLSNTYVASVPGTLQFSVSDNRGILFAFAEPAEEANTIEFSVGVVKLSRSEVVQRIDSTNVVNDVHTVQMGAWNDCEDSVLIVANECELFLYRRNNKENWCDSNFSHRVDTIKWHPSGLLIAIGSSDTKTITLVDCALETLHAVTTDMPIVRPVKVRPVWLSGDIPVDSEQDRWRVFADEEGVSKPTAPLGSPILVRMVPFRKKNRAFQAEMVLLMFTNDNATCVIRFPRGRVVATWRSILRYHLLGIDGHNPSDFLHKATNFVLSLDSSSVSRLKASCILVRELSKHGQLDLPRRTLDFLYHWIRVVLGTMRTALSSIADSKLLSRWKPLVESCERRYISQRLRLGQVELAYQFAYKLAHEDPGSAFLTRMFDEIVVWAATFGQSDTISPLARSTAQKLREYQRDKGLGSAVSSEGESMTSSDSSSYESATSDEGHTDDDSSISTRNSGNFVSSSDSSASAEESGDVSSTSSPLAPDRSKNNSGKKTDDGSELSSEGATPDLRQAQAKVVVPKWENGAGGSVIPEQLGKILGELEEGKTKQLSKDVEKLWREWRKTLAAGGGAPGLQSPFSIHSPISRAKSPGESGLELDQHGMMPRESALRLGRWLECRGKFVQALEIYQSHGLHQETQQLKQMQRAIDPSHFKNIPNVSILVLNKEAI